MKTPKRSISLSSPAPRRTPTIEAKTLAALCASLTQEKKADNVRVLDVSDRLKVTDYFVIATGLNKAHVRALFNELHVRLKAIGERHQPVEGAELGWWVVLDYSDVVVHLFQDEARSFYDLEGLYADCGELDWTTVELPELPPTQATA